MRCAAVSWPYTTPPEGEVKLLGAGRLSDRRRDRRWAQQQAGTLVNPFPAFTFEDLGLKIKATPHIHNDGEITMALEVSTRALSGRVSNGVPEISNRELQTRVRVRDGETVILTGLVSREETQSRGGWPGLGDLPGLGLLFADHKVAARSSRPCSLASPL